MNIKIFIIHVSTNTERLHHIQQMMEKRSLPYPHEYINEGDIPDITDEQLDMYFIDKPDCQMHVRKPYVSCSLKHLLALERIIQQDLDGALVLEDDIFLHENFTEMFEKSLAEAEQRFAGEKILISYEDSPLLLVPRSKRVKGQMLYDGNHDRYTGALFLNRACAEAILDDAHTNKTHLPIDGYHNNLLGRGIIRYLWCHPCIATQGSCNGKIHTLISSKSHRLLNVKWFFKSNYKKLLYWLR